MRLTTARSLRGTEPRRSAEADRPRVSAVPRSGFRRKKMDSPDGVPCKPGRHECESRSLKRQRRCEGPSFLPGAAAGTNRLGNGVSRSFKSKRAGATSGCAAAVRPDPFVLIIGEWCLPCNAGGLRGPSVAYGKGRKSAESSRNLPPKPWYV